MDKKQFAIKEVERIQGELEMMGLEEKYSHPGCYSISIDDTLVYIGKSENMLHRIASHIYHIEHPDSHKYDILNEARSGGHQVRFGVLFYSGKTTKEAIYEDIGVKEGELIREFKPDLNYQIPTAANYKKYTINKRAKYVKLFEILHRGEYTGALDFNFQ